MIMMIFHVYKSDQAAWTASEVQRHAFVVEFNYLHITDLLRNANSWMDLEENRIQ